ncbi:MAG: hypothetical protein NTU54_08370 [Candidatus Omnitrophica bacterium]|nr:hypothetical protein [Candidatus Omnitrophota bacterium]
MANRISHIAYRKTKIQNLKFHFLSLGFTILILNFALFCFAQQGDDLELTQDVNSNTIALPRIFRPNVDVSGRGSHRQKSWPQGMAAQEVLQVWDRDIGFSGFYRLQYNLWEIQELAKDKPAQEELLNNYDSIIKKISDAGGIVVLDIFGTPAGLGKVLDKKSPPIDPRAFKELLKSHMRTLSCEKKYSIWYEVWSAPDTDEFFLGKRQEYLTIYRAVAEAARELENETKTQIPVGGPSVSWWFQDLDGNTIINPERSLIYELIRFCYHYRLPLDFISWHAYSTDPKAEQDTTVYKKSGIALIRDWLSYFRFNKHTPFIIDEWNFDSGINLSPARHEKSNIAASYIPARLKGMYEAGIDNQVYFCMEDFQNNTEGVMRNTGAFWYDAESQSYKGSPKSIYNIFRMLHSLDDRMFIAPAKSSDEFVGLIATKKQDEVIILIYNYIDPDIVKSFLSRNIASLSDGERRVLLNMIKTNRLDKVIRSESDVAQVHAPRHLKQLLIQAQRLNEQAAKFSLSSRTVKLNIKNLKGSFLYQRFTVDSLCGLYCDFVPKEDKNIQINDTYQDTLVLNPYSVTMLIFRKWVPEPEKPVLPLQQTEQPVSVGKETAKVALPTPEQKTPVTAAEPAKQAEPAKEAEPAKQAEPEKQTNSTVIPKATQQGP